MAAANSSTQAYTSLQSYWSSRRAYRKLDRSPSRRIVKLGGRKSKRPLRVGPLRKVLRFRLAVIPSAAKKLLLKMRDAYVNAMLVLAGGGGVTRAGKSGCMVEEVWGKRIPKAREVALKGGDFEMRMMMHIYNTLMANPRELISCA